MKKYLLVLMAVMCTMCITHAQNQGYSWTFGVPPPYTSVPAITGSTGSHTLGLLGDDPALLVHAAEPVGLGTSCTTPYSVTEFGAGGSVFGVEFINPAPQVVTSTYTIEMAVRFNSSGNFRRILGFDDLTTAPGDDGIYITPNIPGPGENVIVFRVAGFDSYTASNTPLLPDVWYFLTFVRTTTGEIIVYVNGVEDGRYDDAAGDFIPKAANANKIHFFRDNDTDFDPDPIETNNYEEAGGKVAKLSIYGRRLTESEIFNRTYNNICNTDIKLAPVSNEGHQWVFPSPATPPFASIAAVAGSEGVTHTFNTLGGSPITTGTTASLAALGGSCAAGVTPVAVYPTDAGLEFLNDKKFVYDTYTIEMAISFDVLGGDSRKLFSFEDLSDVPGRGVYGVYVNPVGHIEFFDGVSTVIAAAPLSINTWYHLVFKRAADGTITYYQNGAEIGTYTDADDDFIPQSTTGHTIVFFKDDDGTNETSGSIAKLAIFASPLSDDDVLERFANVCNTSLVLLPVNLKSFTVVKNGGQVDLTWITSSEQDNRGFEIERSNNGHDFATVGFVNGKGTTNQENTYHFTDLYPVVGKNYYRLKQIDIDSKSTYSEVRSVDIDKFDGPVTLFPNPGRSAITVRNLKNGSQVAIYNAQGSLMVRKIVNSNQESISVDKLAAGVYIMQITDRDNNKQIIRFSKF